jgi:exodeoxyribonuclease VII large subunit
MKDGVEQQTSIFDAELKDLPEAGPHVYSVAEIASDIRENLREFFGTICVRGELADFKGIARSGHLYCALKDDSAQIRIVMWKGALSKLPFELKAGLEVFATGKIDFYGGSGSLQLVVDSLEPVGIGALQLRFEQLRAKLEAEGLFAAERKRVVKPLNWRIGIITSKSTAAFQDILKVYRTRFPLVEVFLFHASVQGEKAPQEIAAALEMANRFSRESKRPLDVLILTRGGGSYEDLFCFNEEKVVRAIAASQLPVVSAVGHEIDVTLSDLVADKRSATPSHAAQETVPELRVWLDRLNDLSKRYNQWIQDLLSDLKQNVDTYQNRIVQASPLKRLERLQDHFHQVQKRLEMMMSRNLQGVRSDLSRFASVLEALSPLKVLERGYTLVLRGKSVLRSSTDLKTGDKLQIRFHDGLTQVRVDDPEAR